MVVRHLSDASIVFGDASERDEIVSLIERAKLYEPTLKIIFDGSSTSSEVGIIVDGYLLSKHERTAAFELAEQGLRAVK